MVQYAQKECYDCLGIFSGNQMVRISETRETGSSHRVKDTFDSAKHRVHYREKDLLICRGCRRKRRWKSFLKWAVLIGAAAGLYVYLTGRPHRPAQASDQTNAEALNSAEPDAALPSRNDWVLKEEIDPMSDARIMSASRDIQAERFLVQATVKCVNAKSLIYEFSTFDSGNSGVAMTSPPDTTAMVMMKNGLAPLLTGGSPLITSMIRFQVRADEAKARTGYIFDPKFENTIVIGPRTLGVKSVDLASAATLLVRLPTHGGSETIEVDQRDPNLASVIQACLVDQDASSGSPAAELANSTVPQPSLEDQPIAAPDNGNIMDATNTT